MKKFIERTILFFLLIVTLTGCKKNYLISDKQEILFQFEYVNYAWGYQHNGFLIDKEGNILTYNNPEGWNFPDKEFGLTVNQVLENINICKLSGKKVSKSELQKYTNYIENIASSKVSALKNVAADAGSIKYICYLFSEDSGMYKGSIIKMEGDFTCENLNFYTKKVTTWMKDIHSNISENF